MSIEYDVVENKMTVPASFTCRPVPIKVLGYDEIASIISAKNPSVTPNLVKCVLQQLSWITEKELLAGNAITLTNFVSIYLSIQSKLRHPDEPIPKDGLDIIGDPAPQFVKDVSDLATFTRRGFVQKAPKIESEIDSNSGIPNWIRPGHAMTLTGSNLKFSPLRGDEGVFLTSPAGNTYLLDVPLFLSDKKVITMPIIDSEEGPAGKASVAYDLTLSARFASSGEVKTGSFLGRIRATNVIDQTNDLVFVSGSSATAPARIAAYTGEAMLAKIVAWMKPNNSLMIEAGTLTSSVNQAIPIIGNGTYDIPGLDGLEIEVTDYQLLRNNVISSQRYMQEIVSLSAQTTPGGLFVIVPTAQPSIDFISSKTGMTNKYSVYLPSKSTIVFFYQETGVADVFKSVTCQVSSDAYGMTFPVTNTQTWDDPSQLNGGNFEDSMFTEAGNGNIICTYGRWGITIAWHVNDDFTLTLLNTPNEVLPAGYDNGLECCRAAVTFDGSKVLRLLQESLPPYSMRMITYDIDALGNWLISPVGDELWDQSVEYIRSSFTGGKISSCRFGNPALIAIAVLLYDNTNSRLAIMIADAKTAHPVKWSEMTLFASGTTNEPIAVAGDKLSNRFVLFFTDTQGNIIASLFSYTLPTISQVGSDLVINDDVSSGSHVGSAVWPEDSDYVRFVSGTTNYVIKVSADGIELVNKYTFPALLINGMLMLSDAGNETAITSRFYSSPPAIFAFRDEQQPLTEIEGNVLIDIAVSLNQNVHYKVVAPVTCTQITFSLSYLTGDLDLYARALYPASLQTSDGASANSGLDPELVQLANTGETDWFVMVNGFEAGSGKLIVTFS